MLNPVRRVILGLSGFPKERCAPLSALLVSLIAFCGCAPAPESKTASAVEIGSAPQIFVDNVLIDRMDGVVKALGRPAKLRENPVIKPDRPWEGYLALQPGTATYDPQEQIFKIWYNSLATTAKPGIEEYLCYATSRDGITWEKPNLGLVEYKGSKDNNILLKWSYWTHSVLQDPHDSDANRRYKLAYWQTHDRSKCGIWVAFSPDGIRWTDEPANPVVPCAVSGDTFSVLQDPATKQFILYHKSIIRPIRKVARLVSDDFVHWRDSRLVLEPDQYDNPDTEFYGMSGFPYGGQQLGLVWVFHTYTQFMDMQLASSRDGLKWERAMGRRLFFPLGFMVNQYGGRSFDSGMVWPANAPTIKDDELWIFYSGFSNVHNELSEEHDGQIGAAKMRLDGFVSLEATSEGSIVTQPIRFKGSTLTVNAATRSFTKDGVEPNPVWKDLFTGAPDGLGWVRVEIQDEQGAALAGYEAANCELIRGDSVDLQVAWKDGKTLSALAGRAVRLKFLLANASLYSFKVGE
jgi:hypothetical protein